MISQYPNFHKKYTGKQVVLGEKTNHYLEFINLDDPGLIKVEGYFDLGQALLYSKIRQEFRNDRDLKKSENQWLSLIHISEPTRPY